MHLHCPDPRGKLGATSRLTHERCQAVFDALGYGIMLLTPQGRIEQLNHAMAAMLGRPAAEVTGRAPHEVVPGHPAPSDACPFVRMCKSLHRESAEVPWGERWFQVTADPVLDAKHKLTGAVVTVSETTEQKRLEEQLRRSQKMEAIGRLAGVLAHDFGSLLTMINGYCQMLMEAMAARDPRRRDLAAVLEAAGRATALTRQMLTIGRHQPARPRRLDLNHLISRLERVLRRVAGPRIHLSTRLARPLGRIQADPAQIEQILVNLVVNAREAMPRGGRLAIATERVRWGQDGPAGRADLRSGNYVSLSVQDSGKGMDAETRSHLFEPFFTTKAKRKGVGLGLSIVYGIVKQSRGDIEVVSEPGQGTTFRIRFPAAAGARRRAAR